MNILKNNATMFLSVVTMCINICTCTYVYGIHEQIKNMKHDVVVDVHCGQDEVTNIEYIPEEMLDNDVKTEVISQEDLELLSLLTMAEAEGETEEGQRLVISTVLNRVDSKYFPNSISEVILQKNQFTSMWNGRVERFEVREDISNLVLDELGNRSDYDVIFFNSNDYSTYGKPLYKKGSHYFSSYN